MEEVQLPILLLEMVQLSQVVQQLSAGGSGYQVGDVLGIDTIGVATIGRNARLTIAGIGHTNELVLNDVQGEFVVGAAKTLLYTSTVLELALNLIMSGAQVVGGDVQISSINETDLMDCTSK